MKRSAPVETRGLRANAPVDTIPWFCRLDDRSKAVRLLCAAVMLLLPSGLRGVFARRVIGWDIHPSAYLGRSLIRVGKLTLGPGASIGPWNVIRDLDEVSLGEGATIGSRNWIHAHPLSAQVFTHSPGRRSALIMGAYAMVTTAHELDCSDRIELRDYARLAGFRSQVLTHSLDLVRDRWITTPVELGERCAVMSGCVLLNGTRVPARAIVSAGSVVTTKLTKEQAFYRGNPAQLVRELPDDMRYFRHQGKAEQPQTFD